MQAKLWMALEKNVKKNLISGHTPGHKNGHLVPEALREAWGEDVWRYDKTEIEGLDNLAHPTGALKSSMAGWARERGCAHVQYLLGGTSLGLKASILALGRGKKIFVPRHAHHSIIEAMVLSGSEPIYLDVDFDSRLGIPIGVKLQTFKAAAEEHPDCKLMVVVHPTYHGFSYKNHWLFAEAKKMGITTIVDGAHSAHFCVTPGLTQDALSLGGDVVIESAHKTLPCLTQASIMLIRDEALVTPLTEAVALLHTTSPSYLLMASLEASGVWLFGEGRAIIEKAIDQLKISKWGLGKMKHLVLEETLWWFQDPFKLYFTCPHASGEAIGEVFRELGLECEMTDGRGALVMLPLDGAMPLALFLEADKRLDTIRTPIPKPCYVKRHGKTMMSLSEAYYAQKERVPLVKAKGRVAAQILEAYPPGIPLLLPGERINKSHIDAWLASGQDEDATLLVVKN